MSETNSSNDFLNLINRTSAQDESLFCPDVTGLTLSGFRVLEKLRVESGEADLYICRRDSGEYSWTMNSNERYVLKIFRRPNAVKDDVIARLKGIMSPYVSPVCACGVYDNHQYVIRPCYKFPSLGRVLEDGGRFSEEHLRKVIIPSVNEGLKALHDAGIIHKDLKPANLLPDDSGEHIVIIDFGISTSFGNKSFVVTRTGMTPFYAAPEALQGVFHRESDYYALGITIFELFTGSLPSKNRELPQLEGADSSPGGTLVFPENFPEDLRTLVLGLTYGDLSGRNDPDNPDRRWGYNEVRRWLNGEKLPVPGASRRSRPESGFPPYRFGGITYHNEGDLLKALFVSPEMGAEELLRGTLVYHYLSFDEQKGALCKNAARDIEAGADRVQVLMDLLYRLDPCCEGLGTAEFGDGEYRFRNAGEFRSYIEKLRDNGGFYELLHLRSCYGKALRDIAEHVWHSDVHEELEKLAEHCVKFGERIFGTENDFIAFLTDLIAANQDTPLNLKRFVHEHELTLEALKARPLLEEAINGLMKYTSLKNPRNGIITVNGVRYPRAELKSGEYLIFGSYWQENSSVKTPLEWLVLQKSGNEALVISRYGLDCKQYHHEYADRTWENCDLRAWLNGEFLRMAFSEREQQLIRESRLVNEDNREYHTRGGADTRDRIFCLSISEARKYFREDAARQCSPTRFAVSGNCFVDDTNGCCYWWLRTPGHYQYRAALVTSEGDLHLAGGSVLNAIGTVRPAMRIDLSALN
ncbi:DUF6273 domain-containing protein [Succinimonas amylolytica]|uniref:DUF6273 domain-containing protein n=1 Tax=Succinimonas amylolytica TaxID=83769 RepID=UPI0023A7B656